VLAELVQQARRVFCSVFPDALSIKWRNQHSHVILNKIRPSKKHL